MQLLTILEVVIHDPLYKWMVSPLKARQRQAGDDNDKNVIGILKEKNKNKKNEKIEIEGNGGLNGPGNGSNNGTSGYAAERTLLRIKNKLQGFDDPTSGGLGVEGQVGYIYIFTYILYIHFKHVYIYMCACECMHPYINMYVSY
jgi:ataxia telangiectasia mutated family protein